MLKPLNEGMEPNGLRDADEREYKGIQAINYILAPGMLKRYSNLVRCKNLAEELVIDERITLNRKFAN